MRRPDGVTAILVIIAEALTGRGGWERKPSRTKLNYTTLPLQYTRQQPKRHHSVLELRSIKNRAALMTCLELKHDIEPSWPGARARLVKSSVRNQAGAHPERVGSQHPPHHSLHVCRGNKTQSRVGLSHKANHHNNSTPWREGMPSRGTLTHLRGGLV